MSNQNKKEKLKIKAKDEVLQGKYSNLMQITHSKDEFVLDFFLASPPQGILTSRVIMSPSHAKRMAQALQENIAKYERNFQKIKMPESPKKKLGFHTKKKES